MNTYHLILKGIILHSGSSAKDRHYVSIVKKGKKWILFDDISIYTISQLHILDMNYLKQLSADFTRY